MALVVLRAGRRAWIALLIVSLGLVVVMLPSTATGPSNALVERVVQSTAYLGQDLSAIEVTDANFAVIERLAHWQAAWRMFSQHPWLGVGIGQYAAVYPTVALPRWSDALGHAHNYYLHVLSEMGLIGITVMLGFWASSFAALWRRARTASMAPDARPSILCATAAIGTLGYLAMHSMFDNLFVHEMYLLVALIMALAMFASTGTKSQSPEVV